MLNLGCGTRMHPGWNNLDFSHYALLARHRRLARLLCATGMLSETRRARLRQIDPTIIHWDLRRGVPFPDGAFDVVYHSHVLEHIDRCSAPAFLRECYRVLKPGGIIRVVVPDLYQLVDAYCLSIPRAREPDDAAIQAHHVAVERLIEQMVRDEPAGTRGQSPLVRRIERLVRGDARQAGELHRWMYDRLTLGAALLSAGFGEVHDVTARTSRIDDWASFKLDENEDGSAYISGSLYMEAVKQDLQVRPTSRFGSEAQPDELLS